MPRSRSLVRLLSSSWPFEAEAQSMTSPGGVERIDNTARRPFLGTEMEPCSEVRQGMREGQSFCGVAGAQA